jgi:4-hydroxy-tetrahydrodipicolinate synthase
VFEGVSTALITPFRDGEVDEPKLQDFVEFQIAAGVDGLVPCGSTGESATMSHAEHRRVIELVVAATRGRAPVIAGTGSNNTREAIELTRHAKEAGADGALLISPYYNKPTQEGIVAHYSEIARATDFPLVVYNIPGRTASNLLPATIARLAEIEQVVGVKEACGDLGQISDMIVRCPAGFAVLSGDDALTLPIMAVGGCGVISTSSNVAPTEMIELVRSAQAGNFAAARVSGRRECHHLDPLSCGVGVSPGGDLG